MTNLKFRARRRRRASGRVCLPPPPPLLLLLLLCFICLHQVGGARVLAADPAAPAPVAGAAHKLERPHQARVVQLAGGRVALECPLAPLALSSRRLARTLRPPAGRGGVATGGARAHGARRQTEANGAGSVIDETPARAAHGASGRRQQRESPLPPPPAAQFVTWGRESASGPERRARAAPDSGGEAANNNDDDIGAETRRYLAELAARDSVELILWYQSRASRPIYIVDARTGRQYDGTAGEPDDNGERMVQVRPAQDSIRLGGAGRGRNGIRADGAESDDDGDDKSDDRERDGQLDYNYDRADDDPSDSAARELLLAETMVGKIATNSARHYALTSLSARLKFRLDAHSGRLPAAYLIMDKLKANDTGEYKCRVDFRFARTRYRASQLDVITPVRELELRVGAGGRSLLATGQQPAASLMEVNEDEPLRLECSAGEGWPSAQLAWWRVDWLPGNSSWPAETLAVRVTRLSARAADKFAKVDDFAGRIPSTSTRHVASDAARDTSGDRWLHWMSGKLELALADLVRDLGARTLETSASGRRIWWEQVTSQLAAALQFGRADLAQIQVPQKRAEQQQQQHLELAKSLAGARLVLYVCGASNTHNGGFVSARADNLLPITLKHEPNNESADIGGGAAKDNGGKLGDKLAKIQPIFGALLIKPNVRPRFARIFLVNRRSSISGAGEQLELSPLESGQFVHLNLATNDSAQVESRRAPTPIDHVAAGAGHRLQFVCLVIGGDAAWSSPASGAASSPPVWTIETRGGAGHVAGGANGRSMMELALDAPAVTEELIAAALKSTNASYLFSNMDANGLEPDELRQLRLSYDLGERRFSSVKLNSIDAWDHEARLTCSAANADYERRRAEILATTSDEHHNPTASGSVRSSIVLNISHVPSVELTVDRGDGKRAKLSDLAVALGASVRLTCGLVFGNPTPTRAAEWLLRDENVDRVPAETRGFEILDREALAPSGEYQRAERLTIQLSYGESSPEPDSNGNNTGNNGQHSAAQMLPLRCKATNPLGYGVSNTLLLVVGRPPRCESGYLAADSGDKIQDNSGAKVKPTGHGIEGGRVDDEASGGRGDGEHDDLQSSTNAINSRASSADKANDLNFLCPVRSDKLSSSYHWLLLASGDAKGEPAAGSSAASDNGTTGGGAAKSDMLERGIALASGTLLLSTSESAVISLSKLQLLFNHSKPGADNGDFKLSRLACYASDKFGSNAGRPCAARLERGPSTKGDTSQSDRAIAVLKNIGLSNKCSANLAHKDAALRRRRQANIFSDLKLDESLFVQHGAQAPSLAGVRDRRNPGRQHAELVLSLECRYTDASPTRSRVEYPTESSDYKPVETNDRSREDVTVVFDLYRMESGEKRKLLRHLARIPPHRLANLSLAIDVDDDIQINHLERSHQSNLANELSSSSPILARAASDHIVLVSFMGRDEQLIHPNVSLTLDGNIVEITSSIARTDPRGEEGSLTTVDQATNNHMVNDRYSRTSDASGQSRRKTVLYTLGNSTLAVLSLLTIATLMWICKSSRKRQSEDSGNNKLQGLIGGDTQAEGLTDLTGRVSTLDTQTQSSQICDMDRADSSYGYSQLDRPYLVNKDMHHQLGQYPAQHVSMRHEDRPVGSLNEFAVQSNRQLVNGSTLQICPQASVIEPGAHKNHEEITRVIPPGEDGPFELLIIDSTSPNSNDSGTCVSNCQDRVDFTPLSQQSAVLAVLDRDRGHPSLAASELHQWRESQHPYHRPNNHELNSQGEMTVTDESSSFLQDEDVCADGTRAWIQCRGCVIRQPKYQPIVEQDGAPSQCKDCASNNEEICAPSAGSNSTLSMMVGRSSLMNQLDCFEMQGLTLLPCVSPAQSTSSSAITISNNNQPAAPGRRSLCSYRQGRDIVSLGETSRVRFIEPEASIGLEHRKADGPPKYLKTGP